jgi:hypothetical protein
MNIVFNRLFTMRTVLLPVLRRDDAENSIKQCGSDSMNTVVADRIQGERRVKGAKRKEGACGCRAQSPDSARRHCVIPLTGIPAGR